MTGRVAAVCTSGSHTFAKTRRAQITLVAGLGVVGDAHMGATVKHRSRVARDPSQPNLRQVHLIPAEVLDELRARGFTAVVEGAMGENITTRDLDVAALPVGTRLLLGADAEIELTGRRNPCAQLNGLAPGLLEAVLARRADGTSVTDALAMAVVVNGGVVAPGDDITVTLPAHPHRPLERV